MEPKREPTLPAVLAAFAVVYVVWGSTYLAIQFAVETLPPFLLAGARFLAAGLALLAIVWRWLPQSPTLEQWRGAAIVGCLMLLGGNGLVCWAEKTVPSGIAALLVSTAPIWFVFLDWALFSGPRPGVAVIAGIAIGMFGVYLLVGPGEIRGARPDLWGSAALLSACVFWATGSLLARRVALPANVFASTAMQMITAGIALLTVSAAAGEWAALSLANISMKSALSMAYLAVFGSLLALTCYTWLIQVSTPARVATYAYVNPVVAVALGAALNGEPLSTRVVLAMSVIVAAVVLITTFGQRAPRRSASDVAGIAPQPAPISTAAPSTTRSSSRTP